MYLCSESKGADQLCGYRTADLRLCFAYVKSRFSHDAVHIAELGFTEYMHTLFPYFFALKTVGPR